MHRRSALHGKIVRLLLQRSRLDFGEMPQGAAFLTESLMNPAAVFTHSGDFILLVIP